MYWDLATQKHVRAIYAEFNATEESIKNDVQHLISWIEKRPHLPNVSDEKLLISFLLQCKNSVENAKTQIEMYYICKTMMPNVFTNRDPAQLWFRDSMNTATLIPLPKLTSDCYRIVLFRIFKHSSSNVPSVDIFTKANIMLIDLLLKEDRNSGIILVYDFENISAALVAVLFANSKHFLTISTKVLKFRPQKIYLLNVHSMIEPCITLCKSLLQKKLVERILVWKQKPTDLVQVLPKEVLPSDYGGNLPPSIEIKNQLYDYVCEFRDWFLSEEHVKADLTKKPKDCLMNQDIEIHSGIDGSFRKLSVD